MMRLLGVAVLSTLSATVSALYNQNSAVISLTETAFQQEVLKGDEVWFVEFFAPWCGHCKNLVPEWESAAKSLKGVVKVGAVDGTTAEKLMRKYDVKGFPTLKIFGADKKNPVDYQGERKADAIVSAAMKAVNDLVKGRKGGKADSGKGSKPKSSSSSGSGSKSGGSNVIELTESNFESLVLDSKDQWLVEFFAPWCGHCKALAPEWESAANQLKGSVKLGAVDATVHSGLASTYGVKGYPTIKVFPAGKKSKSPKDYNGPRDAAGIVDYSLKLLEESGIPPAIHQLTSEDVLDEACGENKICAIMFVPNILDSGANARNAYLKSLENVASKLRGKPITYVWSEGGAQPALEEALEVTFGYPAMVLLAKHKGAYALLKTSWSESNIVSFVNGVLSGSEKRSAIGTIPKIQKVSKWDGKDAVLEVDEIPLSEIMGD